MKARATPRAARKNGWGFPARSSPPHPGVAAWTAFADSLPSPSGGFDRGTLGVLETNGPYEARRTCLGEGLRIFVRWENPQFWVGSPMTKAPCQGALSIGAPRPAICHALVIRGTLQGKTPGKKEVRVKSRSSRWTAVHGFALVWHIYVDALSYINQLDKNGLGTNIHEHEWPNGV